MIDGILLLDKPVGLSSTAAGLRVRRLLGASKAGHVGSLDPLATGMLPICLGEATKLAGEILEGDKVYRFRIALGVRTATGDVEGEALARQAVPQFGDDEVRAVLGRFIGVTLQVPPMYSAIKQGGVPLYKLARAGETVDRPPRSIRIESLDLLGRAGDTLDCRVVCGKGTYVRVLAEDIAVALGTVGHVAELRREQVAPFDPSKLVTLAALEAGARPVLVAPSEALPHLKAVRLGSVACGRLVQGQVVDAPETLRTALGTVVRVEGPEGEFLGLGRVAAPGRIAPKRLVAQKASE